MEEEESEVPSEVPWREGLSHQQAHSAIVELLTAASQSEPKPLSTCLHDHKFATSSCALHINALRLASLLAAIGSVNIENEVCIPMLLMSSLLFILSLALCKLRKYQENYEGNFLKQKILRILRMIDRSGPLLKYPMFIEPLTEDMVTQHCIRDSVVHNVPKILLVPNDVLLLRPGQAVPCDCETEDGRALTKGEKIQQKVKYNSEAAVEPLLAKKVRVVRAPLEEHVLHCVNHSSEATSFDDIFSYCVHNVAEKYVLPLSFCLSCLICVVRFLYADDESFYGTRYIFAIPVLHILPLLCPSLPILLFVAKTICNQTVCNFLRLREFRHPKNLVVTLAAVTGTSVVDKKGILAKANPGIDKLLFFRQPEQDESMEAPKEGLISETLDLGTHLTPNGKWRLEFDDIRWKKHINSLLPLAHNIIMNDCEHNEDYFTFLDHLTAVSETIPRTIASASRRCMCHLPMMLRMDPPNSLSTKILGLYKCQPGDAPLPGLTKHRTPVEMSFCTVHSDDRALYSHIACQGTAGMVLESSTHVWNGKGVVPLTKKTIKTANDFYNRHSMTGYCLALSYRPTRGAVSEALASSYFEVPLHNRQQISTALPRSHSSELINDDFFEMESLTTCDQVLQNMFTGHVLCGLVVMQYEALPQAIHLTETFESNCVRFVYFSRENELRSRVFAEKLGLEAGWNCHISLAEESTERVRSSGCLFRNNGQEVHRTLSSPTDRKTCINMFSKSDLYIDSIDSDSTARFSPEFRRQSTFHKIGPIPNHARLPTGVKNVRPHLEQVDNVPLLVGLFTDSTPPAMAEMIQIMKEYGEVVLLIGSSLNAANSETFGKADISVCARPALEANCCKQKWTAEQRGDTSLKLASEIMALAVDLPLDHDQLLLLPELILRCRHRMQSLKAALFFLFFASSLLSLAQMISTVAFLPLFYTLSQVYLFVFIQLPLLFFGIVFGSWKVKKVVIRIAPKNDGIVSNSAMVTTMWTLILQFLPTAIFLAAAFFIQLVRSSNLMCSFSEYVCTVHAHGANTTNEDSFSTEELRHEIAIHTTVYLCVLSSSWVYSLSSFFIQVPFIVPSWVAASTLCILSQIIFSYSHGIMLNEIVSLRDVLTMVAWSTLIFLINEARKIHVVRKFAREQRRTKLGFDTKLGMNSPY